MHLLIQMLNTDLGQSVRKCKGVGIGFWSTYRYRLSECWNSKKKKKIRAQLPCEACQCSEKDDGEAIRAYKHSKQVSQ